MTQKEIYAQMRPLLNASQEAASKAADNANVLVAMLQAQCSPEAILNNDYVMELRGALFSRAAAHDDLIALFRREPVGVADILREMALHIKGINE